MERWRDCVAVVTGASSGIGAAIVKELLAANIKVAGLARREELVEALKKGLPSDQQDRLLVIKCDVSSPESIEKAFQTVTQKWGGVDILVNNAGVSSSGQLVLLDEAELHNILKVNVMGVVTCTRHAFESMKKRNVDGHVVIINSILGHRVPMSFGKYPPLMNIYPSSKFALTALTEMYRHEFAFNKTGIRITSVSPGFTDTDMVPDYIRKNPLILKSEDVAKCVTFAISMPQHAQVHEITVQPTAGSKL